MNRNEMNTLGFYFTFNNFKNFHGHIMKCHFNI